MVKIIKELFRYREVCYNPKYNNYSLITSKKDYEINIILIESLIDCKILIEDSGNFETGEVNYIYNTDIDSFYTSLDIGFFTTKFLRFSKNKENYNILIEILRDIKLNRLLM